jgi:NitT/TauT family transport system substrate-binding protein
MSFSRNKKESGRMRSHHTQGWSRRQLLHGLSIAGAMGVMGFPAKTVRAEPAPETTRLRLTTQRGGLGVAPKYIVEALLTGEGFTALHYAPVENLSTRLQLLASGETDLEVTFIAPFIARIDAADPIVLLAGSHIGCFELFGTAPVHAIRDLKGKTVAVSDVGNPDYAFLANILVYIGLDPRQDIHWVTYPPAESVQLLAEGKIDAFLGFPPVPQELRARQIGHVILNSSLDRPWSQYFCCMVAGNREFVRTHPVATRRALRARLVATDVCALEPERAAQSLVDRGLTPQYTYALQTMQEVPYSKWREYDPEDTVRFYALRLHEAGLITSSAQKIIQRGTDWHLFNALKKELKG